VSGEFEDFLRRCGIQHRQSPHYHPQGNAAVERFNRFLKDGLKTHLEAGIDFKDAVKTLLWSYRATPHALTGVSPAELMTGRKISTPLTALQPRTTVRHRLASSIKRKQQRVFNQLNTTRRPPPTYMVGDWVRVKRPFARGKLSSRLSEPREISKIASATTVILSDGSRWHVDNCIRVPRPVGALPHWPTPDPTVVATPTATAAAAALAAEPPRPQQTAQTAVRVSARTRAPPQWYGEVVTH
jgi:hypothetical protein